DMPMTELIETQCLQDKQLLLIEPNMQAASITQQILTQEGLVVTYRSVMPDESTSYDYVLLNLAANQEYQFDTVSGWAIGAKKIAQNVIIGTPSTELALGEQLMKEVDVQCITKP
ncbi:two-component sensor histidine kinase BarA, partial [Vibrio lentus]|nr:two-component sensor histidine kinase BarA [Vibrio lentus]